MLDEPHSLRFDDAPDAILAMLRTAGPAAPPQQPAIVAVCGPVASGKSTLARLLAEHPEAPPPTAAMSTDDYLPDYTLVPEAERDDPSRSDLPLLAEHLVRLGQGEAVADAPVWSFHSHRREGTKPVGPARLIVVEGIFALQPCIAGLASIRVFVDAPKTERWARWERLELDGTRGWGVERARAFFEGVAEPSFDRFRAGYRAAADLIVTNP